MNKNKKIIIIVLIIAIVASAIGVYFYTNQKEALPLPKTALDNIVEENVAPLAFKPNFGGKIFGAYNLIASEKTGDTIKIYMYLVAEEYYVKDNKILKGTAGAFPTIVVVKQDGNKYIYEKAIISRVEEEEEANNIFPKAVQRKARGMSEEPDNDNTFQQAKKYFNIK